MAAVRKKLFAGRFEIEEEAGAGGAGTVYRARDVGTGERVALKVLRTPVNTAAERFSREAQTLAMLRHPAVVRYISHGVTEDGESYLAMEWLEGQDLRRHLGQQGISVAETVALGIRVAGALAAVHALGVLHRDVKPSNLFLVGGRVTDVKLIDFGLVRLDDVGHSLTRSGVAVGTPGYMAPEQARGDRDSDQRADVFSLGCVLFKCLTGRPPFEGSHLVAVLTKVLLEDAPRVRSLRPDLLDALDALIARMLEKDPARRPAGAAEVADALRSIEANGLADSSDPALAPASRQFSGLTDSEQRIAAVLLIAPAADLDEGAARAAELESLVDRFACHLERLTDGTRVITIARPPTALDQAARIARCALAARELLPGVPMALATGWSVTAGQALMGEAIDRAAGLLAQPSVEAARSGIAVDEVTAALLDTQFTLEVTLEGEAGGPGSARLTGLRDTAIVARTLLGKVTPCLGREWELSTIEAQLGECAEECRAVALVFSAPAGMGKSRLAVEAVAALQRSPPASMGAPLGAAPSSAPKPPASSGVSVWLARGDSTREGSALGLLAQALRCACSIHAGQPVEEQRRRLAERVAATALAGDASRLTEFLGELLGVPFPDDASPALRAARHDPQLAFEQMRRAFIDFLSAECVARPVLLLLDDLHWADPASIRFLDAALSTLERAPLMVLAFARPEIDEQFPRLWAGRNVQRLRLKPLSRKPTERLARLALGPDADSAIIGRVVDLAEGNVFFLEELIRAVAASKRAGHGEPTSARFLLGEPSSDSVQLPQTVLGMVQARLDAIDPGARRLLRAASIYGEAFWPGGVTALLGGMSTPVDGWVEGLVAGELVVRRPSSRFPGEPELVFRNALLREGAYAMLTDRDRAAGHLLAATWLEQHGEREPSVLARHFELGGDAARAALQHVRVAEEALRASELVVVSARVDHAVALGLPEPTRVHALGLRCEAETWRNDWAAAAATAEEVLAASPRGSAPWARAAVAKQGYALITGDTAVLMSVLTSLWSAEPEPDAVSTVLYALHSGVFFLCLGNQFATATRLLERVDALAPRGVDLDPTTEGRVHMSHQLVDALGSGDPERALSRARAAHACYQRAGDPGHLTWAQLFLGIALWGLGSFDDARRELAAISATGARAGLTLAVRDIYEGLALIDAGALDEARAVAERAASSRSALSPAAAAAKRGEAAWIRAEVALRTGDLGAAERDAREALDLLRAYPIAHTSTRVLLAAALLQQGRGAEAREEVREPLTALERQGGRGFRAARTALVAAEALAASGDDAEARRVIGVARASLLQRAAGIGDPEQRRGFLERVPENARTLVVAGERLGAVG